MEVSVRLSSGHLPELRAAPLLAWFPEGPGFLVKEAWRFPGHPRSGYGPLYREGAPLLPAHRRRATQSRRQVRTQAPAQGRVWHARADDRCRGARRALGCALRSPHIEEVVTERSLERVFLSKTEKWYRVERQRASFGGILEAVPLKTWS